MALSEDPVNRHREVAGDFARIARQVRDWDAPAPVAGWTARDVVGHLVGWFPGFLAGGTGIELPIGPPVEDDPVGAWVNQADAVQAVLEDPATPGRVLTNPHLGEVPLPAAIDRFYTADVFMHTWDLATASGQPVALDPGMCRNLYEGLQEMEEILRSSGQYGPRVDVPDDADIQTKLIGFIGRDPHWRP